MNPLDPQSDVDLYCDAALIDPYPIYERLRASGPATWLSRYGMVALSRYKNVKEAMGDAQRFSSAQGVMMNDVMNSAKRGNVLCSDNPVHATLRRVVAKPITPLAIQAYSRLITEEAQLLAERLVARGHFDAATELAQHLPVTIVSRLVGLPEEGRERMLTWAAANFQCFGPLNRRATDAFATVRQMMDFALEQCSRDKLAPDGWARMLWDAAERGEISRQMPPRLLNDYLGPSLDTTIFATSSAIWLFANNPAQWKILRENPSLIPGAINEVVRLESPLQGFSRVTTEEVDVEGFRLPKDTRVLMLWGSANRDERKWDRPECFDIQRRNADHLGFGYGLHVCVGMHLAKMEISALLKALLERVERFELGRTERVINNVLRGFSKLEVTVS